MRRLVSVVGTFVEWLDAVVLLLIIAAGLALGAVLILDGGGAVEVSLIGVLTAVMAFGWWRQSWASEKLGKRPRG